MQVSALAGSFPSPAVTPGHSSEKGEGLDSNQKEVSSGGGGHRIYLPIRIWGSPSPLQPAPCLAFCLLFVSQAPSHQAGQCLEIDPGA